MVEVFLVVLKKITKSPLVQQIRRTVFKKAVNYVPELYELGTSKIKNKTARKILQSDTTTKFLNNLVTKYSSE